MTEDDEGGEAMLERGNEAQGRGLVDVLWHRNVGLGGCNERARQRGLFGWKATTIMVIMAVSRWLF